MMASLRDLLLNLSVSASLKLGILSLLHGVKVRKQITNGIVMGGVTVELVSMKVKEVK